MSGTKRLVYEFFGVDAGASATMDKLGGKLETSGAAWGKYAAAAGIAVAAAAAGAVDLADKFEEAHTRLEGAVKNVGGSFTALQAPLGSLDDRMAHLGFTSTDVEGSLAGLVTATKNPTEAIHLMGLAADIARGRNMDLADATTLLVKVETGHVGLLGRLGIATKDASGATITETEAIRRLTTLYGGDASRYASTFAGKVDALKAQAEDFGVTVGTHLIPVLTDLIGVFETVVGDIGDVVGWFERHEEVTFALAGALTGALIPALVSVAVAAAPGVWETLVGVVGAAKDAMIAFAAGEREASLASEAFEASLGPVGIAMAALGAVVGLFWHSNTSGANTAQAAAEKYVESLNVQANSTKSLGAAITAVNNEINRQFDGAQKGVTVQQNLASHYYESGTEAQALQGQLQSLVATQTTVRSNTAALSQTLGIGQRAVRTLAGSVGADLGGNLATLLPKLQAARTAAHQTHQPVEEAASSFADLSNKANAVTQDITDLDTAWSALVGNFVGMKQAQLDAKQALDSFDASLKKSHGSLSLNTADGQAARAALLQLVPAINTVVDKTYSQTGSYARAAQAARQWLQGIKASGAAGPLVAKLTAEIHGYLQHLASQAPAAGSQTGHGFGAGLVTGLKGEIGAVRSAAAELGGVMLQGTKDRIVSKSPSKEAMKIGQDFDHGIVIGIKNKTPVVRESAAYVGKMLTEGLIGGWTGSASTLKDALTTPIQNALEHLTARLQAELSKQQAALKSAIGNYKQLEQNRQQAIGSLRSQIVSSTDVSGVLGATNQWGQTYTGNIGSSLSGSVSLLRTEARDLARLRKMGLSQALISQISAQSPQDAVTLAQQILSGQAGSIASLNRNEALIQTYAKRSATTVVESPHEQAQLRASHKSVDVERHMLAVLERMDHRADRRAARDVAANVTIELHGSDTRSSHANARAIVAELHKLGVVTGVRHKRHR